MRTRWKFGERTPESSSTKSAMKQALAVRMKDPILFHVPNLEALFVRSGCDSPFMEKATFLEADRNLHPNRDSWLVLVKWETSSGKRKPKHGSDVCESCHLTSMTSFFVGGTCEVVVTTQARLPYVYKFAKKIRSMQHYNVIHKK